jgi:hypothetical protein
VSVPLKRSDFSMWAELTNSTGRRNPCCDRFLPPQAALPRKSPSRIPGFHGR